MKQSLASKPFLSLSGQKTREALSMGQRGYASSRCNTAKKMASGAKAPPTAPCQLPLPQINNVPTHASSSLPAIHISMSPKHPGALFPAPRGTDAQPRESKHREGSINLKVTQHTCSAVPALVFP